MWATDGGFFIFWQPMETAKNIIIPPHFQCPNFYVDVLDEYLTAEESKVLIHAVREILGWRDSLQSRQKHIARDIFLNGRVVNDKKVYGGVNICADTLNKVLDALHHFRILVKSGSPRDPRGQLFELTEDVSQIDIAGLQARKEGKKTANKTRINSSSNKTRLSHRQVNNSSATQTSYSPVTQTSKSSVTQTSYSSVTQTERKTRSEIHKEKDREREEQPERSEETSTASHTLSSSPSGMVFLSFFREECKHLSTEQVRMICDIPDPELLKSAIEYLQGNGVEKLWKKVSLLKTKMQELAAVPKLQSGAGGAASSAALPESPAKMSGGKLQRGEEQKAASQSAELNEHLEFMALTDMLKGIKIGVERGMFRRDVAKKKADDEFTRFASRVPMPSPEVAAMVSAKREEFFI